MVTSSVTQRLIITFALIVLAAVWSGSAAGDPPERSVAFDATSTFTSPFCGDAPIVEHDVGRMTFTVFFNADGTFKAATVHPVAITQTLTNTATGATLTDFFSQFVRDRETFDPTTGVLTLTEEVNGLNFIIRGTDPPLVSAGRGVITYLITFDAEGNPHVTVASQTSTPNLAHLTGLLCG